VIENAGYTYIIDKTLLSQAQPIKIDYISNASGEGFLITSSLSKKSECGGCTGC
jgi:Fe-S cluster assembly iron-binding protein IscA